MLGEAVSDTTCIRRYEEIKVDGGEGGRGEKGLSERARDEQLLTQLAASGGHFEGSVFGT